VSCGKHETVNWIGSWRSLFDVDGVHLWDRRTGRTIKKLRGYAEWDAKAAFSRDGSLLATTDKIVALDKCAAIIWDANTGIEKQKLLDDWAWEFALSPDGKTIATGGGDYNIKLWDIATGQLLRTFLGHSGPVRCS
jgi:WD40 repeat protein